MSLSTRTILYAPLIGGGAAVGLGMLFGKDAEPFVVGLCIGAVLAAWLYALRSSQRSVEDQFPAQPQDLPADRASDASLAMIPFGPMLDVLPIGVLIADGDQQVIAANSMMRDIFTLPNDPGYPVETLRAQQLLRAVDDVQRNGGARHFEMTLTRRADVALRVHVQLVEGEPESPRRMLIAVEDITKARLADEVHRDFVANASHELKTPLAVVSGLIETLQGPAKNDPAGTERFLNRLASQTERMTRLIDDLMSLNRIEMNQRVMPQAPLEVNALVAETVDALRPAADAMQVELHLEANTAKVTVLADREELEQLFGNLIDNAIKYGGSGGVVRVGTTLSDTGDEVSVRVSDNGPGIAREHLPRLTERFYRVDIGRSREHGGTGLGLAICKHIVNRHRGRIQIESVVGKGTTFTVRLPCVQTAPSGQRKTANPAM